MSGDLAEIDETPVAEMSFENALAALEDVVSRLEDGKVSLETSIELYQRGAELKARCEALLAEAELKVSRIVAGADGPGLVPEAPEPPPAEPSASVKAEPPKRGPDRTATHPSDEDDIPF